MVDSMTNPAVAEVNSSNSVTVATNTKAVLQSAAQAAVSSLSGNLPAAATAFQAFASELESLAETEISAVGGPIAGMAADVIIPEFVPVIINSISTLFNHIGSAIPTELTRLQNYINDRIAGVPETSTQKVPGAPVVSNSK